MADRKLSVNGGRRLRLGALASVLALAAGAAAAAASDSPPCMLNATLLPDHATAEGCGPTLEAGRTCTADCEEGYRNTKNGSSEGMLICTRGSQLDVAQFGECVREGCRVDDTLLEHATVVGSDCEDGVIPNDGFCEPKCEVGYQSKKEHNFVLCAKSELNFEMFACVATTPAHALAPAPAPAPALAPSPTSILCNASAVNQKPHDLHGQPGACTEVVLAINATCALECDSGYTLGNGSTGIRTCNVDGTTSDDLSCVTDNKPALTPAPAPAPAPVVAPALAPSPISNICNAFAVNQKPRKNPRPFFVSNTTALHCTSASLLARQRKQTWRSKKHVRKARLILGNQQTKIWRIMKREMRCFMLSRP